MLLLLIVWTCLWYLLYEIDLHRFYVVFYWYGAVFYLFMGSCFIYCFYYFNGDSNSCIPHTCMDFELKKWVSYASCSNRVYKVTLFRRFTVCVHRNLSRSVSDLVCAVIVLSQDDMSQVSDIGKQTLQWFSDRCEQDSGKSLLEMLENSFYSLLTRIPRILEGSGTIIVCFIKIVLSCIQKWN